MKKSKIKVNKLPIFLNPKLQEARGLRVNIENQEDNLRIKKILQNGQFYTIRNLSKLVILALIYRNIDGATLNMDHVVSIGTYLDSKYKVNIASNYIKEIIERRVTKTLPITSPGINDLLGVENIMTEELNNYLLTNESVLITQVIQQVVDKFNR